MIRTLEGRLRGKNPNDDKFAVDFEHLSNLKKELGLPVGFKTETENLWLFIKAFVCSSIS